MRSVAIMLMAVVPLAACPLTACGSDADPASDSPSTSDAAGALTEEDRALIEDLSEVLTTDPDIDTEELERAADLSAGAVDTAEAIDLAPCDLVTIGEIEEITGYIVEEVRDDGPIHCRFDLVADSDLHVLSSVDDAQGRLGGPAALFLWHEQEGSASPYEVIEGVGERAIYASRGLIVDAGDGRYFSIGVGGQYLEFAEPLDELIVLAERALERI